jgi:hypothetical protein
VSLIDRIAALPGRLRPPGEPKGLLKAANSVKEKYGNYGSTKPVGVEALIAKAVQALQIWSWINLTEGDVAILIRALAAKECVFPQSLEAFFLAELRSSTRHNFLRALCEGFVASWAPRDSRTAICAQVIVDRSEWLPRDWQICFSQVPELLDTISGAETFGLWLAAQSEPYRAVIDKGIAFPHGLGFMQHVHNAWLASLPPQNDDSRARRLLSWIKPKGAPVLRGNRAAGVVGRLLQPWSHTMPADTLRSFLATELVDAYGDPRRENAAFWHEVGAEGQRVMLRWLAGRRMEVFLDVVSRAEAIGEHGDQWVPRRRFWMGIYQSGRIDEAWISFGRKALEIARNLGRQTNDIAYTEFGQTAKSRKDTCLLIMRIGKKIVVEGSHNFRIHIFEAGSPKAPGLYANNYDVDLFLLPLGDENARVHDAAGHWMEWVRRRVQ